MYVAVDDQTIEIEFQQLYQRLLVTRIGSIELSTLFQYEFVGLASHRSGLLGVPRPLTSDQGPPSLVLTSPRHESSAPSADRATS